MESQEVYIACDHAGFALKARLGAVLAGWGHNVHDLGTDGAEARVDYPDFARELAQAIKPIPDAKGILICGSGIGMAMMANRYPWVRAAVCADSTSAGLARQHNDANVLALGARLMGEAVAVDAVRAFVTTEFAGGRHLPRVEKLRCC